MPRFVLLEHDHPHLHWDFMLESGPVLKTWRFERLPSSTNETIAAEALGDHRLAYLDYEGPVSSNRGQVLRREQGTYEVLEGTLDGDRVSLRMCGERWQAVACLTRISGKRWTLTWSVQISDSAAGREQE